jgi:concentrative nucleoside transporter, CNT family
MTQSELLAMMTGGMATIAGSVLIVYVSFGAIPGHLLTASVMSAPAALMIAKILLPETEISETANHAPLVIEKTATNGIDALCQGASDGMRLSMNVIAMLIAFVALIAMANYLLQLLLTPFSIELTLQQLVGWINAPFAWLIGVPAKDCSLVGQMLGERIVLNEFFGYVTLTQHWDQLDERSRTLATYALCGFANFGSVAIQIGGIGVLVPERRNDLARLGLLSMVGGLLTCYTTAAMVGILL